MTGNMLNLLDYKLKFFLQNNLGWVDLTDIQKEAIPVILNNEDSLIIAPTASGKTEAALIPIYNNLITKSLDSTAVLYIAPLKALINDMDKRIYKWNKHFGLTATKWHGDVSVNVKNKFLKNPTDILLITPESLEVFLINKSEGQKKKILGNIKYVIIDEIHYFIDSDRGIQLNSLLKRITEYSENFIKIGLSATVGNPKLVAEWMDFNCPAKIIRASGKPIIHFKTHKFDNKLEIIDNITKYANYKVLLFCNSRKSVEEYNKLLKNKLNNNVYLHHSSIDKGIREDNEELFKNKDRGIMVSTTTLELGIDIGNIDIVSMITPPTTVSSFIQKIGRSGRKTKKERALLFIQDNLDSLKYLAQMNLAYYNIVEKINIRKYPLDVYLHQILSIIFQKSEVNVPDLYYMLNDTYVFKDISKDSYRMIIKHLVNSKILTLIDRKILCLGDEFEKIFGHMNFLDFYSVFSTSSSFKIKYGLKDIGELDVLYVFGLKSGERFTLGGQYWEINDIDYKKFIIYVKKSPKTNKIPRWNSGEEFQSYLTCREIYRILLDEYNHNLLEKFNEEFRIWFKNLSEYTKEFKLSKQTIPIVFANKNNLQIIHIYTFAGGKVNYLLSNLILEKFEIKNVEQTDYHIKIISSKDIVEDLISYYNNLGMDNINLETDTYLNSVDLDNFQTKFSNYLPEKLQETTIKGLIFNFEDLKDLVTHTKMEIRNELDYTGLSDEFS